MRSHPTAASFRFELPIRCMTLVVCLGARGVCGPPAEAPANAPAAGGLERYVTEPDESYRWKVVRSLDRDGMKGYVVDMTSQSWRDASEVDRTEWQHWVRIAVPGKVATSGSKDLTALLIIGGGKNGRDPPAGPDGRAVAIARASGAVVAEVGMVPNQPLRFAGDDRDRYEDDLIAYTWNRFLDTGDASWLARGPMVKSAVRAMDTVEAVLAAPERGALGVQHFVVAGGSKRGWTTWLTGVFDPRVVAIIPIVIDVLNVIPSMDHHFASYGFWAPAVGDYERNGIMDRRSALRYRELNRLVDPYHYRNRLKMPKYLINSSGDEFFLPDSSRFYFDDLLGEKYLRYVPNTKHSLSGSDAVESIAAYLHSIVHDVRRPRFSWTFEEDGAIRVIAKDPPSRVRLWQAENPKARDFRLETIGKAWKAREVESKDGVYVGRVKSPETGFRAFFIELTFDGKGPFPLKFTTAVRVLPDVEPFREKLEELKRKQSAEEEATGGK